MSPSVLVLLNAFITIVGVFVILTYHHIRTKH